MTFNKIKLIVYFLRHKKYTKIKLNIMYHRGVHLYLTNAFGYLKLV